MKVNLSTVIRDNLVERDKLLTVINDLVLYSLPQVDLFDILKNKN